MESPPDVASATQPWQQVFWMRHWDTIQRWKAWCRLWWWWIVFGALYTILIPLTVFMDATGYGVASCSISVWLFQRVLAVCIGAAFVSALVQLEGLVGSEGILPAAETMELIRSRGKTYADFPCLCHFRGWSSDAGLRMQCWLGVGAAVAMGLNVMPSLAAIVCAVTYLSIKSIGREFWALQWDNLIIEACVPAVFMFATPTIVHMDPTASYVPLAARFMAVAYAWMCFRLMFSSGVVKLFSGDVAWANWSALQYHFFSQPIPNWIAWYAHNCVPPTVLRWACGAHFFIEIVAPFFAFFPPLRGLSGLLMASLMVGIIVTGNYGFFNIICIAFCIPMIPDTWWPYGVRYAIVTLQGFSLPMDPLAPVLSWLWMPIDVMAFGVLVLTMVLSLQLLSRLADRGRLRTPSCIPGLFTASPRPKAPPSSDSSDTGDKRVTDAHHPLARLWAIVCTRLGDCVSPVLAHLWTFASKYCLLNSYGLFAVMTTDRAEVIVEGSMDGVQWKEYHLYYKPSRLHDAPVWIPLGHMPRLDWRLWFCQFGRRPPWFESFVSAVLEGKACMLRQHVQHNPFAVHDAVESCCSDVSRDDGGVEDTTTSYASSSSSSSSTPSPSSSSMLPSDIMSSSHVSASEGDDVSCSSDDVGDNSDGCVKAMAPKYVRACRWYYEFTTLEERRVSGEWWKRRLKNVYLEPVTLIDGRMTFATLPNSAEQSQRTRVPKWFTRRG